MPLLFRPEIGDFKQTSKKTAQIIKIKLQEKNLCGLGEQRNKQKCYLATPDVYLEKIKNGQMYFEPLQWHFF